jgi:hypothetical protein
MPPSHNLKPQTVDDTTVWAQKHDKEVKVTETSTGSKSMAKENDLVFTIASKKTKLTIPRRNQNLLGQ